MSQSLFSWPSPAVYNRRAEAADSLDFYPTPPWATRAFIGHVLPQLPVNDRLLRCAWDPACGEGHMAEVLRERFSTVYASDIFDYGRGYEVEDFLVPGMPRALDPDLIVTNPPFNRSIDFVLRALTLAPVVAVLVRLNWLEGQDRYARLFDVDPPTLVSVFAERVPMTKGRWDPDASTATAYAWISWVRFADPRPPFWIPPGCRERLTAPTDRARFAVAPPAPLLEGLAS